MTARLCFFALNNRAYYALTTSAKLLNVKVDSRGMHIDTPSDGKILMSGTCALNEAAGIKQKIIQKYDNKYYLRDGDLVPHTPTTLQTNGINLDIETLFIGGGRPADESKWYFYVCKGLSLPKWIFDNPKSCKDNYLVYWESFSSKEKAEREMGNYIKKYNYILFRDLYIHTSPPPRDPDEPEFEYYVIGCDYT